MNVLVAITFHFREHRLHYLSRIIEQFLSYGVEKVDIRIVSNTSVPEERRELEEAYAPHLSYWNSKLGGREVSIEYWTSLRDPWALPWCHKHIIRDDFISDKNGYDYFIYVEDDILIPFDSFSYYTTFLNKMKKIGFMPGFQRIEYNKTKDMLYMLDAVKRFFVKENTISIDGIEFICPNFPYAAMFVLDRELGVEYVASNSFHPEKSKKVKGVWGGPERAAMGLTFEGRPAGYPCRYLIPIEKTRNAIMSNALVYHIPNNYCENPNSKFGKVPVSSYLIDFSSPEVKKRIAEKRKQRWLERLAKKAAEATLKGPVT